MERAEQEVLQTLSPVFTPLELTFHTGKVVTQRLNSEWAATEEKTVNKADKNGPVVKNLGLCGEVGDFGLFELGREKTVLRENPDSRPGRQHRVFQNEE